VKEIQLQIKLPGVPLAKQGREVPPPWEWTEAAVWTERMLATLERGITGGKWYSLGDKVWKMENRNIFPDLDGWVRGRLRTILRKRHKRQGKARGKDHQKWPNAYFDELGLISLALTRAKAANAHQETH